MKHLLINIAKNLYATYTRFISKKSNGKLEKKQVVYLLSFPNNDHGLIKELAKDYSLVVCYTKGAQREGEALAQEGMQVVSINSFLGLTKTIQAIGKSPLVIADNYFPFLGDIKKQDKQTIIQLWHATGAIKQFGLEDKSIVTRSQSDKERFKRVYRSFDYYVVGSKAMGEVFQKSYGAKNKQLLYLGFPRTDYLKQQTTSTSQTMSRVLYLPTYRQDNMPMLVDDLLALREKLPKETSLHIKAHPTMAIENAEKLTNVEGIQLVDEKASSDELLLQADCLITDYSSVAFDYALINPVGKLIFYWFDEAEYNQTTGIQPIFKQTLPTEVCHTLDEVMTQLDDRKQDLHAFNEVWNTYNDGFATQRLLEWIKEKMDGEK
ncbi:CDP-glycerol glycerophosphotransferase family protein [Vagococcus sp. DIV0080]|uniref:CDP-glycerol glycerophosphotransferase family protein n=1 Tax=Candidatus Vagococcus giribetii TaxID=2230876 RepID=A0ABS3HUK2_9ENTE|nr:CDP-glycerol glycerophosphotransferase family protein [Vagococcus sp. DIV0080]MBO0477433.1 CDP-glycerol glycerophosphotransferase family protein [Vagococcus sp. DIV0080]